MINSFVISTFVVFLISWVLILFFVFDTFKRMYQVKKFFKIAKQKYVNKTNIILIFIYCLLFNIFIPIVSLIMISLYLVNHIILIGYFGIGICIFDLIVFIIFIICINKLRMNSIIVNAKDNLIFTDLIISYNNILKIVFDFTLRWIYFYYNDNDSKSLYKFKYSHNLKIFLDAKQEN
ncbi:hypothetical protein [Spiroplasma endosymbiont of Labia minor]|uniref:hypothetical protein n=1 Tax=Spiroplasma endosymbiont of Labia minor TaxID=3066305 RepID=UPI0030D53020